MKNIILYKLDSHLHDLEHLYYDGKNWAQNLTKDDILKSKFFPVIGAVILVLYVVRKYCAGGVCKSKARLDGKTVIITGSNTGIGKETAKDFYGRGARVIMACRNQKKAQKATTEIFHACKHVSPDVVGQIINYNLDLSSITSITNFCQEIIEKEDNIDILVNNAGIIAPINQGHQLTEDGFDLTIGTNHLGPFLLTNLLLEKLSKSLNKPARIVNVASDAYRWGDIQTKDLNFGAAVPYPGAFKAYGQSKLCNILFSKELSRRVQGQNISVYVLHPGTVQTNIATNIFPWYIRLITDLLAAPLLFCFSKSTRQGAQTTIYCAVEESIASESGKYYVDCKQASLKFPATDQETAEKLWTLSEKLVKLEQT